jgi:NAD(P)H-dependent FMN reductase
MMRLRHVRILAVSGSLQAKSQNVGLLTVAARLAPPGIEVIVFDGLRDLPHFNPDVEASGAPESVVRWRQALSTSDAILIASPEYAFSFPGALKNAIDWVIGTGELEGKVVGITAAVLSPERGRRGLQALRDTLSAVRATIVGGEPTQIGFAFERQVALLVEALASTASERRRAPV